MTGWMDEAMETLRPWIGRVRTVEDDIGMMAVRRVAATFDVDPDSVKRGDDLLDGKLLYGGRVSRPKFQ